MGLRRAEQHHSASTHPEQLLITSWKREDPTDLTALTSDLRRNPAAPVSQLYALLSSVCHAVTDRQLKNPLHEQFFSQRLLWPLEIWSFFRISFICVKTFITLRSGIKIPLWPWSTSNWVLILIFLFLEKKPLTNATSEASK